MSTNRPPAANGTPAAPGTAPGPVPPKQRWFDDYAEGETFDFGDYLVTADEIIEFARRYDPQPFHVDPQAAAAGPFGGLIASGWMTWLRQSGYARPISIHTEYEWVPKGFHKTRDRLVSALKADLTEVRRWMHDA